MNSTSMTWMLSQTKFPVENQIIGYNEAQDQYVLKSAGEISYVDSSELFQKVSNGEKIFVEGVKLKILFQDSQSHFKTTKTCSLKKIMLCMCNI
jgi:hypothetical protein